MIQHSTFEGECEKVLDMIEKAGTPAKLDLSRQDAGGIDLSGGTIRKKRAERGWPKKGKEPPWYSPETRGIDLRGANLQGMTLEEADLSYADLRGADLSETKLQRAELSNAALHGAWLRGARLDRTHFRWENLKECAEERYQKWAEAREVYRDVKVNFKGIGYYGDARWAYLKERRIERKSHFPSQDGAQWVKKQWDALPQKDLFRRLVKFYRALLYIQLFLYVPEGIPLRRRGWALNGLEDLFLEYMESPFKIIAWTGAFWLIFSLAYWWLGLVKPEAGQQLEWWDYPIFSLRTAVTLAFNDLQPVGWWGKALTAAQGGLGVIFFALFGYAVAKRIARD
ncbi:MAG: pentapeptide repeat-containing protein [Chloroflexota bacterium]|nr:pentapeptide repeat-containing protein [Chloroflexota bacterium]